jgi:hypothetical protein
MAPVTQVAIQQLEGTEPREGEEDVSTTPSLPDLNDL